MSNSLPEIPKQWIKGLVPTLNDKGFMFEVLDDYANEFIRESGASREQALEIGCAYGIATIAALEAGAHITAVDMDARHLEVLQSRVSPEMLERLTVQTGTLPDIDLPELQLQEVGPDRFLILCRSRLQGMVRVLVGMRGFCHPLPWSVSCASSTTGPSRFREQYLTAPRSCQLKHWARISPTLAPCSSPRKWCLGYTRRRPRR